MLHWDEVMTIRGAVQYLRRGSKGDANNESFTGAGSDLFLPGRPLVSGLWSLMCGAADVIVLISSGWLECCTAIAIA